MLITKAIEILNLNIKQRDSNMPPDVMDALMMSHDGLVKIQLHRTDPQHIVIGLLKGETEQ